VAVSRGEDQRQAAGRDHDDMDHASVRYTIRIRGRLGATGST
jgi:hypothetical protein